MLERLLAIYRLKDEKRAGWLLRGIEDPESVADHSWGTAFLSLFYANEAGVDVARAVAMALVHDTAEALTGDVPRAGETYVSASKRESDASAKAAREREAMAALFNGAPAPAGSRMMDLWEEYERATSPEACFVRDMNLLDMCLQALLYERDRRYLPQTGPKGHPRRGRLDEFFTTTRPRLSTELGKTLFEEVHARYLASRDVEG